MSFVIVSDHDRICHRLSNDLICMVFDGEDDLKAELFILMSTITGNPHRKLDLHGSLWKHG